MASIFSTQNLQTFLRRKYLRPPPPPPSRPPPGPPGRDDGRRSPRSGRSPPEDDSDALVSSAMMLLNPVVSHWSFVVGQRPEANDQRRLLRRSRGSFPSNLSRGHRRCRLAFRVFDRLDLIQALLLLINAHGEKLDHRLGNAQPALQFMNQATTAFDSQQHVNTVVKLPDGVSQPPLAHALDTLHQPGRPSHSRLQRGNKFVLILLRHIRPDDEHQFISTIHSILHLSRIFKSVCIPANLRLIFHSSGLRLKRFIAAAAPSVTMAFTALAATSSISSTTLSCALRNGDSK